jgi:hypothetical protein
MNHMMTKKNKATTRMPPAVPPMTAPTLMLLEAPVGVPEEVMVALASSGAVVCACEAIAPSAPALLVVAGPLFCQGFRGRGIRKMIAITTTVGVDLALE